MKTTGVVRRIDDLGRIVIPKEIRRNLKIRDGEELEIFLDNETICLKKFSKVAGLDSVAKKILDVSSSMLDKTIIVSDRDIVIAGSGSLKKNYVNKEISSLLEKHLSNRSVIIEKNVSNVELINNYHSEVAFILYPIICYGDVVGSVVLLSEKNDLSEFELNITKIIADFLGKYVED